jgi:hypothetical protein
MPQLAFEFVPAAELGSGFRVDLTLQATKTVASQGVASPTFSVALGYNPFAGKMHSGVPCATTTFLMRSVGRRWFV